MRPLTELDESTELYDCRCGWTGSRDEAAYRLYWDVHTISCPDCGAELDDFERWPDE